MINHFFMAGEVTIVMSDVYTKKVWTAFKDHNMIVLGARSAIASFLTGGVVGPPSAIALGTGTASATAISAAGLQFEIARSAFVQNNLLGGYSAQYVVNFGTNQGNGYIQELGLFGGTFMYAIASASANKTTANTMAITWTLGVMTGSAM